MLKRAHLLMRVIIAMLIFSNTAFAGTDKVAVALPSFAVQLNGVKINNTSSQYPLLVYQDITYFPMTFSVSRFMGLETKWSPENWLKIEKTGIVAEYKGYETDPKNAKTGQAKGNEVFKTSDRVVNASAEGNLLVYRTYESQNDYVERF